MSAEPETFDRRFHVSEPAEFVLTDISGTVTISSWNLQQISVKAIKRVGGFLPWVTPEDGFRATRVEMEQQGSRVVVRTTRTQEGLWGFMNWLGGAAVVDYTVMVPPNCNIVVDLVNGSLTVEKISGSVIVRAVSANCSLRKLEGKIAASTVSGSVYAEDIVGQAAFKTVSGAVTVQEGRYLSLTGGSVSGDFSIDAGLSPDGRYEFQTVSGSVKIGIPSDSRCVADVYGIGGSLLSEIQGEVRQTAQGTWHAEVGVPGTDTIRIRMDSLTGGLRLGPRGFIDRPAETPRAAAEPPPQRTPDEPPAKPASAPVDTAPKSAAEQPPSRESVMMSILAAVERGELTVEEAAERLGDIDLSARDVNRPDVGA